MLRPPVHFVHTKLHFVHITYLKHPNKTIFTVLTGGDISKPACKIPGVPVKGQLDNLYTHSCNNCNYKK
jgi:hypothetical protein